MNIGVLVFLLAVLILAIDAIFALVADVSFRVHEVPEDRPHDVERVRTGLFPWNYVDVRVPEKK